MSIINIIICSDIARTMNVTKQIAVVEVALDMAAPGATKLAGAGPMLVVMTLQLGETVTGPVLLL